MLQGLGHVAGAARLNAKQVQAWPGHQSAAFTLSVYVHMLSDEVPNAAFWDTHEVTTIP
jgi:hypothetical protein